MLVQCRYWLHLLKNIKLFEWDQTKNETKNLILKSLRICSCHCVYIIKILLFDTPPKLPRKLKNSWCNNLRARFRTRSYKWPPLSTNWHVQYFIVCCCISNYTCSYCRIFHIPICLLNFYIQLKPVFIFMNVLKFILDLSL